MSGTRNSYHPGLRVLWQKHPESEGVARGQGCFFAIISEVTVVITIILPNKVVHYDDSLIIPCQFTVDACQMFC